MMTSKIVLNHNAFSSVDANGTVIHPEYRENMNGTAYTYEEWGAIQVASLAALFVGIWQVPTPFLNSRTRKKFSKFLT
jgi:hypothetical protein